MCILLIYISVILAYKTLLYDLSKKAIRIIEYLIFKAILRIYCKLFFKYLTMQYVVKSFRAELGVRSAVVSFFKIRVFSNLSISVLNRDKAWKVALNRMEETTKAQSLQK